MSGMFGIAWRWSVCCVLLCLVGALLVRAKKFLLSTSPIRFHRRGPKKSWFRPRKLRCREPGDQCGRGHHRAGYEKQNIRSVVDASDWHRGLAVFRAAARGPK